MLKNLVIKNFRGLSSMKLNGLGRVNLLVGRNGSGKTSILEAVELLSSAGDPRHLARVLDSRRKSPFISKYGGHRSTVLPTVGHLFHGFEYRAGSTVELHAETAHDALRLKLRLERIAPDDVAYEPETTLREPLPRTDSWAAERQEFGQPLGLEIRSGDRPASVVPLTIHGGLDPEVSLGPREVDVTLRKPIRFIPTDALAPPELRFLFDQLVLTPKEELLVEILRSVEPRIRRLASVDDPEFYEAGGSTGLVARLENVEERIPIESLGEGLWRLLGLALSLLESEGGILLVDEVDTGFHFGVLEQVWKAVCESAERLDVQVFATTHSSDCWMSLAMLARSLPEGSVSIQRVEKTEAISFSSEEMAVAAERGIEVR